MPARPVAGGNSQYRSLDRFPAVKQDDPVHGPHEFDVTITPAHTTRNG